MLTHNRVSLALHHLREGEGRALLLLHGLGEASPAEVPSWIDGWAGPVAALDFTGHGRSTIPVGGGYTAEMLLADADTALAELGQATVLGRGLGAYIALQLAGSRPADVIGRDPRRRAGAGRRGDVPDVAELLRPAARRWSARPVRPRRAEPRPATARLRRGVRPPGAGRLAARRADQRGRRLPPAVAGGRRRRAGRQRDDDPRGPGPLRRCLGPSPIWAGSVSGRGSSRIPGRTPPSFAGDVAWRW